VAGIAEEVSCLADSEVEVEVTGSDPEVEEVFPGFLEEDVNDVDSVSVSSPVLDDASSPVSVDEEAMVEEELVLVAPEKLELDLPGLEVELELVLAALVVEELVFAALEELVFPADVEEELVFATDEVEDELVFPGPPDGGGGPLSSGADEDVSASLDVLSELEVTSPPSSDEDEEKSPSHEDGSSGACRCSCFSLAELTCKIPGAELAVILNVFWAFLQNAW